MTTLMEMASNAEPDRTNQKQAADTKPQQSAAHA